MEVKINKKKERNLQIYRGIEIPDMTWETTNENLDHVDDAHLSS